MKITIKTLGVALLAIAMLFTMAACDDDGGGGGNESTNGRLTITGLEAYNGKYIFARSMNYENYNYEKDLAACDDIQKGIGFLYGQISNGTALLKVWLGDNQMKNYNGNDKNVLFQVGIFNNQSTGTSQEAIQQGFTDADFTNGIGTGVFRLTPNPTVDISNDIDNSLIGTWHEKNTGASLFTLTIAANGITWGGSSGSAVQTATQTLRDQGYTVVWTAKNGKITYIYASTGSTQQSIDVYDYEINNDGEMELKKEGQLLMTLVKQ